MIRFAASSHPGLKRNQNEDCYQASPELGLWLVADGIGGHADGALASSIVRDTIRSDVANGSSLSDAVHHAHSEVLQEISRRGEHSNMGSTVIACLLDEDRYELVWVGDSRCYLYDGQLQQLSRDHNPVSELLARGILNAEQAANHPERHLLSQSLGVSQALQITPGHRRGQLPPRGQLLLCSDGLTDELNDSEIQRLLREGRSPQQQVDALVNAALAAGGSDNITVVVIGSGNKNERPADQNLEITQNIGQAISSEDCQRANHNGKVWLAVAIMLALTLWLWLR